MKKSILAAPGLSLRFLSVWRRNFLVWRKFALASVLGNVAEPLITLLAFGYGLGALLHSVEGIPYIRFLASGAICMSVMMAASFETLYSAFSRMHVQKTWEALLNAPLSLDDIMLAEMLWAAAKALFAGCAIFVVILFLGVGRHPQSALAIPVLFLTGITFASLGLIMNALARTYDFFTYYFTLVLTPMIFLSGVYYPTGQLPAWLQLVSSWLPLTAAVGLVRPLLLGEWPAQPLIKILILAAYAVVAYYTATVITRARLLK